MFEQEEAEDQALTKSDGLVGVTAPVVDFYDSRVSVSKNGMGVDNPVLPQRLSNSLFFYGLAAGKANAT